MLQKLILFCLFLTIGVCVYAQDEENIIVIFKHPSEVNSVAFDPDGKYLISGCADNSLIKWSLETKEELSVIPAHYKPVQSVKITSTGNYVVSAGDRSIKIWSTNNELIRTLTGHYTDLWSVDIHPNNAYLVSGSYDPKFRSWDINSEGTKHVFEGHDKSVLAVKFSPNGKYIASGSLDKTMKLWNVESGELIKTFEGHSDNIYEIDFTSDSKYIATASRDKTVRLWSVERGEIVRTFPGHLQGVVSVDISPNDKYMLTSSFDGAIKLWELANANNIYTFTNHEASVNCVRFSSLGTEFASASSDNKVILWSLGKNLFVNYYFESELTDDIDNSEYFGPKRKNESRTEYKLRATEADSIKNVFFDKYYKEYLKLLNNQQIEK